MSCWKQGMTRSHNTNVKPHNHVTRPVWSPMFHQQTFRHKNNNSYFSNWICGRPHYPLSSFHLWFFCTKHVLSHMILCNYHFSQALSFILSGQQHETRYFIVFLCIGPTVVHILEQSRIHLKMDREIWTQVAQDLVLTMSDQLWFPIAHSAWWSGLLPKLTLFLLPC